MAVVDNAAMRANAVSMRERSPVPIRLASKSIRVRGLIEEVLAQPGFAGVLAYSAPEALWLVSKGIRDVLVAYPTIDPATIAAVSNDPVAAREVTFMVDLPEHLEMVRAAATGAPVRVCLDICCAVSLGGLQVGAHRSSIRTPEQAAALAASAAKEPQVRLVGLMFYDAQIAGVPDTGPHIRWMKQRSWGELTRRRAAVRRAVEDHADLEFVNAGGTGSLHWFQDDGVVTELAAGSGLFAPTLFDRYDGAEHRPAAFFVSPVVRKPAEDVVVAAFGGYIASGPVGSSRTPTVAFPSGLKPFTHEGFGEVQTPLRGPAARGMRIGDPVWFRHAKAGEMCERFDEVLLVDGEQIRRIPTYRGEGKNFG